MRARSVSFSLFIWIALSNIFAASADLFRCNSESLCTSCNSFSAAFSAFSPRSIISFANVLFLSRCLWSFFVWFWWPLLWTAFVLLLELSAFSSASSSSLTPAMAAASACANSSSPARSTSGSSVDASSCFNIIWPTFLRCIAASACSFFERSFSRNSSSFIFSLLNSSAACSMSSSSTDAFVLGFDGGAEVVVVAQWKLMRFKRMMPC
mmetsp:Transcript_16290/g.47193  ORF Transcript_16290/g.47193 Transcript_16290/m.47193 type:complete len:209 (+) Transcript_16290:1199-1825(+)